MTLGKSQVAAFRERGVLVVENILQDHDLEPIIQEIQRFVDGEARRLKALGALTELFEREPFDTRIGHLYAQTPKIVRGLSIMRMRGPSMFAFLRNKRLLDAVSSLIGPEITCNPIQHLRAKVPGSRASSGKGNEIIPWHQDAQVMLEEADRSDIVTCWIPLIDATREMGCMQVIPGAWRLGHLPHARDSTISPEALPDIEPIYAECPKGGVVFMHMLTPHRSTPNISERVRWTMDLRYQQTGTPSGRPFYPDFPVRSHRAPSTVLTDRDVWCRLWDKGIKDGAGKQLHRSPRRLA